MSDADTGMQIRLFGSPVVLINRIPVLLAYQKARALLFYLAATERPHSREHLAALLWSDSLDKEARHSLRTTLYQLRQTLKASGHDDCLVTDGDQLRLVLPAEQCDVVHFRRLIAKDAEASLTEAVALYRGPLLQGFSLHGAPLFEEWVRYAEVELHQSFLQTVEQLVVRAEQRQDWSTAVGYMQRLVQLDPLAEDAQQRIISFHLRRGAIGQAVRQYRHFEAELRRELDMEPSLETQALIAQALQQQREPGDSAPRPPARSQHPAWPFLGRSELLERLLAAGRQVVAGQGRTIIVQGDDGVGKTRLIDELVAHSQAGKQPWVTLRSSCTPFDDLFSYGPFLEAFQHASSGDMSELLVDTPALSPDGRMRFFWNVLRALGTLARSSPVLFIIDDLHWASASTLNLFGFLASRLRSLPVLLIGATRRIELDSPLYQLELLGRRRNDIQVETLTPLARDTLLALVRRIGIADDSLDILGDWLYERSGGNPFLLEALLSQLRDEQLLLVDGHGTRLDLQRWLHWRVSFTFPQTAYELEALRTLDLAPDARGILEVLAVAGHPLPTRLLQQMSGLSMPRFLATLADLTSRRLVEELDPQALTIPRNLLREYMLSRLEPVRRRAIHWSLGEALEPYAAESEPVLQQLVLHAVAGEDAERARRYAPRLLAQLPLRFGDAETLTFLQRLYELIGASSALEDRLRLAHALGRLSHLLGQLDRARQWYQHCLEIAAAAGDLEAEANAHFEIGELALESGDHQAACAAAQAGLVCCAAALGQPLYALSARGQRLLGAALAGQGADLATAQKHLTLALQLLQLDGEAGERCATLFTLGNIAAQRGELQQALAFFRETAGLAETHKVAHFQVLACNNVAYHELLLGHLHSAEEWLERGLQLARTAQLVTEFVHLWHTKGELALARQDWLAAAQIFHDGLALASSLGNQERLAGFLAGLGLAARGQQQHDRASDLFAQALQALDGDSNWHLRTRIAIWQAETLQLSGRPEQALAVVDGVLESASSQGRELLWLQAEELARHLRAPGPAGPAA